MTRHLIGCAQTVRTAVAVTAYLELLTVNKYRISYEFKHPEASNGFWSADIVVDGPLDMAESARLVEVCRAFVAGAGEVWL